MVVVKLQCIEKMLLTMLICQLIQRQSAPKAKNASLSDTNSTPNQHPGDEYSPRCRFNSVGLFLFSELYEKKPQLGHKYTWFNHQF